MKQATVKLPSGEYNFVQLPIVKEWDGCEIRGRTGKNSLLSFYGHAASMELPPGNWQLLGADPTRLTEEEAGEIVESNIAYHWKNFRNYYYNGSKQSMMWTCAIAMSSLDSLAASLGISKPFVVLKNIEK